MKMERREKNMGNEMRDNRKKQEGRNVRCRSHGERMKRVKTVFIMKYRNVFFGKTNKAKTKRRGQNETE
jgi:hypothetical protein